MPHHRFKTLVEMLHYRTRTTPDAIAYTFNDRPCTYGRLWHQASRLGRFLLQKKIQKANHIVLALPNGDEFFYGFYGVLRAGGVAVPVFPGSGPRRLFNMARLSDAKAILIPGQTPDEQTDWLETVCRENGIMLLRVSQCLTSTLGSAFPTLQGDDVAYIQYTSGSTGHPKGVQISHNDLLINVTQLIEGMQITPAEIFVSWLPVYHDMGLILKTLVPFYLGCRLILLPTRLTDVQAWLDALHTQRATFTAAPDFAYRLLLRYVRNPEVYDLSALRVALNAAEPVRANTISGFERQFGLKHVMVAGYGLAEATVGVSMWPPQTPNRVDSRGFVSVGPPFRDIDIEIRRHNRVLPYESVGEITLKSPANTRGYYRNPAANRELFCGRGFIATGDLGYLDQKGNLYVVGRKKNMLIVSGRSLAPREVEEIVDRTKGVRYSAAIGVDRGGIEGEQIHVMAELNERSMQSGTSLWRDLAIEIVSRLYKNIGTRPAGVYFLKPRSLPLTHNGKIKHHLLKKIFANGDLRESGSILFPPSFKES